MVLARIPFVEAAVGPDPDVIRRIGDERPDGIADQPVVGPIAGHLPAVLQHQNAAPLGTDPQPPLTILSETRGAIGEPQVQALDLTILHPGDTSTGGPDPQHAFCIPIKCADMLAR